jgi:hypothetical protein
VSLVLNVPEPDQLVDVRQRRYVVVHVAQSALHPNLLINDGAFPAVRSVSNNNEETFLLVRFLRQAARNLRLSIGSCDVLCPSNEAGKTLASNLKKVGLEASFMEGELWT